MTKFEDVFSFSSETFLSCQQKHVLIKPVPELSNLIALTNLPLVRNHRAKKCREVFFKITTMRHYIS